MPARTAYGARQKGYQFEHSLELEVQRYIPETSRPRAGQPMDIGDLLIMGEGRFVIQAKNVSTLNLKKAIADACQQGQNLAMRLHQEEPAAGVVVWKRPRVATQDARNQYVSLLVGHAEELLQPDNIQPLPTGPALHSRLASAFGVWPDGIFKGISVGHQVPLIHLLFGTFLNRVYPDIEPGPLVYEHMRLRAPERAVRRVP